MTSHTWIIKLLSSLMLSEVFGQLLIRIQAVNMPMLDAVIDSFICDKAVQK